MDLRAFNESLNKKAGSKLNEEAGEFVFDNSWHYVPKKSFLNGLLRVVVKEDSDNKWSIHYLAPGSKSSEGAKKGAAKHMEDMQRLINLSASVIKEEVEGDQEAIKGWTVKGSWSGSFEQCIEKCIDLVQGKGTAELQKYTK